MPRSKSLTGDALQVKALLTWARSQGVGLTRVTCGGCTVDVAPAPVVIAAPKNERPEPAKTIYSHHAGEMLSQLLGNEDAGEWQPVVGRK